jgi:Chalcone isomerase-like
MTRTLVCCLTLVMCAAASSRAKDERPPSHLVLDGIGTVPLAAHARRTYLVDAVEIYTVAIYINGSLNLQRLAAADVAKALRIDVTHIDDLRRRIPYDWRRELVPSLEPAATAHLRGTFAPLQHGVSVVVEYGATKGTTIRVNGAVAVSHAHHDLMLAFLDHWLGQRPVSEDIKRMLLAP